MESYLSGAKPDSIRISSFTATTPDDLEVENLSELASEWLTYDNITSKIKQISRDARPGDLVYIQYSGHGTRQPTASSDYSERDSSDIALVLFDQEKGSCYLRGLALARMLEEFVEKKLVLTIVLDCCYSGGVTRGDPCIRGLDWNDAVDSNYPLSDIMGEDLNSAGADHWDPYWTFDWLRNPRSFSLLTACGPHQRAFEIRLRDTNQTWHGCLSYLLVTSL